MPDLWDLNSDGQIQAKQREQFDTNMDTSNHVSHQEQACAALETGPPQIAVTTASGLHISTHSNSCAHSSQSSPISSANSLNSFQLVEANEDDSTVCPLHPTLGDPQALLSSPMAAAEGPTDQISTADSNFVKGDADDSSMQPQASIASCVPDPLDACVPPVGGSPSNLRVDVEERFGEDGDASVYGEEGHVSHSASESCLSVTTRLCALEEERDNLVTRLLATDVALTAARATNAQLEAANASSRELLRVVVGEVLQQDRTASCTTGAAATGTVGGRLSHSSSATGLTGWMGSPAAGSPRGGMTSPGTAGTGDASDGGRGMERAVRARSRSPRGEGHRSANPRRASSPPNPPPASALEQEQGHRHSLVLYAKQHRAAAAEMRERCVLLAKQAREGDASDKGAHVGAVVGNGRNDDGQAMVVARRALRREVDAALSSTCVLTCLLKHSPRCPEEALMELAAATTLYEVALVELYRDKVAGAVGSPAAIVAAMAADSRPALESNAGTAASAAAGPFLPVPLLVGAAALAAGVVGTIAGIYLGVNTVIGALARVSSAE